MTSYTTPRFMASASDACFHVLFAPMMPIWLPSTTVERSPVTSRTELTLATRATSARSRFPVAFSFSVEGGLTAERRRAELMLHRRCRFQSYGFKAGRNWMRLPGNLALSPCRSCSHAIARLSTKLAVFFFFLGQRPQFPSLSTFRPCTPRSIHSGARMDRGSLAATETRHICGAPACNVHHYSRIATAGAGCAAAVSEQYMHALPLMRIRREVRSHQTQFAVHRRGGGWERADIAGSRGRCTEIRVRVCEAVQNFHWWGLTARGPWATTEFSLISIFAVSTPCCAGV